MAGAGDEYYYGGPGPRGAPHGLLLAVVVGLVVAGPLFLGDGGEALTEAVAELLSPVGLLLLPVFGRFPDAVHRVGGSPVGVAFMLLLILALLYYRSSLFGGDGGDDE